MIDTAIPTSIPLNKLVPHPANVRKTRSKDFIKRLAANIAVHGLQQNLIVIPQGKRYAVTGGCNRLNALQLLAKFGRIKPNHPVPCKIVDGDIDPREISLAENIMREDMHPADAFEAFRDLVDDGIPVADIAARFKLSEGYIRQLLKLARVSPAILAAYREGRLTLDQTKAFAVSDDRAAQEHVLKNLRPHDTSRAIREALTADELAGGDRRVKFVTVKEYETAGGKLRQDLFAEGEDSVFILDTALLLTLAAQKLERSAQRVSKEGWKWTEFHADFGYEQKSQFHRIHPEPAPLPPKLAEKAEKLEAELGALREEWRNSDDEDGEEPARIGKIEEQLDAIEEQRGEPVWTQEQLAMSGAVVTIGHDGKTEILRGLVKPEDMPKRKPKNAAAAATPEGETPQAPALSSALVEDLTAQRSAALAAALSQRPDIALASVVHALASRVFLQSPAAETALQIAASKQSLHRVEGSKALAKMEAEREAWGRKLPATPEELWTWCLKQKQDALLKLLAFCAASTVNAVRTKADRPDSSRLQNTELLAGAVALDMTEWFTPDAKNYFARVDKPQILAALQEARKQPPAPAWEKLKKAELASLAERELDKSGWLPPLLRPAA